MELHDKVATTLNQELKGNHASLRVDIEGPQERFPVTTEMEAK